MSLPLFYSPNYNISLPLLSSLHPFDGCKYEKALALINAESEANIELRVVSEPLSQDWLLSVHTQPYLDSLHQSKTLARVIEMPLLRLLPAGVLNRYFMKPMRFAAEGTCLAVQEALSKKASTLNLGGGYHHAFAGHGEGFCAFADVAIAINRARKQHLLSPDDNIWVIDLDAHRGNGFADWAMEDPNIHIFDMYNMQAYPGLHPDEQESRWPFLVPLKQGTDTKGYLSRLESEFSDFIKQSPLPKLVIYNAGTDIIAQDKLGGLQVSIDGARKRDQWLVDQIQSLDVPMVTVTSGGYSENSYRLIADLAIYQAKKVTS
ncbi:histone deacetylase [Microbulbifer sp. ANSA003]|uniref:histone deacetylase family protein n=1 Tax=Microbulbifer sp. ANSA003 TaxID=3243360 RepID=UPI0040434BE2